MSSCPALAYDLHDCAPVVAAPLSGAVGTSCDPLPSVLGAKQPVEPPVAELMILVGQMYDALARLLIVRTTADVTQYGPARAQHRAGTMPKSIRAYLEDLLNIGHRLPHGSGR